MVFTAQESFALGVNVSQTVVFNGANHTVYEEGDSNWGENTTLYLIAIASGCLQKTGGTFTLTADVDFGANYGLKSTYYKSRHANPASTGQVRLGNTESISWRNAANSANLSLLVNSSNLLEYNGTVLGNSIATVTGTRAAPSAIVAGTGVAFSGSQGRALWFIEGSGGAVDISANPQVVAGSTVGQELRLIGRNDTNTVQFDDGNGLSLNGTCILGEDNVLDLVWDGTNWVETNRSN